MRSERTGRPSICFVALNAYDALSGRKNIAQMGGAEVQQTRIGRWLVRRGYSVSFVTLDYGQPDGADIDGMKVYKAYKENTGIRSLRFIHPRWTGLWSAMARANAEVYYQRCAGDETGQVALWCYLHRRTFIFAAASDPDCEPSSCALKSWREKTLYRLGLKLANAVTVQTINQQQRMRQKMGIDTVVVRNCGWNIATHSSCVQPLSVGTSKIHVLWLGRISGEKRLELLLEAAAKCPEISFDVVGAPNTMCAYASRVMKCAAAIPNVKMHGQVPHDEIGAYYQRCQVLCCTSAYEGFPNTFLEAWSLGIPVVSTCDPDNVIRDNGLGAVVTDADDIVSSLRKLLQSRDAWSAASRAARRYYQEHHSPEVCLPVFEQVFLEVAG